MNKKFTRDLLLPVLTGLRTSKIVTARWILIICLAGCYKTSYSQNLGWAKRLGGPDYEHGRSIAVDGAGNVYTVGEFRGTADFDPGTGIYNLTSFSPCCYDIFISKLDASGNFLWAKQLGGTDIDYATAITVDATGNVYVTGEFNGTADFDPGLAVYSFTSAGSSDIFVLKLNTTGDFVWAAQLGGGSNTGSDNDITKAIAVDAAGNVYTTGSFVGTSDFEPGAGVYNLSTYDPFDMDAFVSKLDANGNFVWAKQFAGLSNEYAVSIAVDAGGNVYTTGEFYNTTDFDPGAGVFNLTPVDESNFQNYDIYISKLDANGNFVWAKQVGGPQVIGFAATDNVTGLAVDASGNVFITGYFPGTADFDPGVAVHNLTSIGGGGTVDLFILKLDTDGNYVWAKQMGGSNVDEALAIAVDAAGSVYTTGYFAGSGDFDPGPGVHMLTNNSGSAADLDIFISKLDQNGQFVWANTVGGLSIDYGSAIAVDAAQQVYITGSFGGTVDFDPGIGQFNLLSAGVDEVFVLKLVGNALPVQLIDFSAKVNDKNAVDVNWTTALENNNDYFTVERSKDGRAFEPVTTVKGSVNSSLPIHYHVTDNTAMSSKWYYRLKQTDLDGRATYSAVVQVQLNGSAVNAFTIYPNPVQDYVQVQFMQTVDSHISWQVQDAAGRILKQQNDQPAGGHVSIDVSGLSKGMYWLVWKADDNTIIRPFIKQ